MSYPDPLSNRERAFEEAYFREESERLLERIRERRDHEAQKAALAKALGLSEPNLLELLLELGVRAENVAALVLAPLVSIAWADKRVSEEERRAIHLAEEDHGIDPQSEAGELLEIWLDHRPHEALLSAWSNYIHALCKQLSTEERTELRDEIVGRSRRIALSLTKSLLRGGGPSDAEQEVLTRIEAAFEQEGDPKSDSRSGSGLDKVVRSLT